MLGLAPKHGEERLLHGRVQIDALHVEGVPAAFETGLRGADARCTVAGQVDRLADGDAHAPAGRDAGHAGPDTTRQGFDLRIRVGPGGSDAAAGALDFRHGGLEPRVVALREFDRAVEREGFGVTGARQSQEQADEPDVQVPSIATWHAIDPTLQWMTVDVGHGAASGTIRGGDGPCGRDDWRCGRTCITGSPGGDRRRTIGAANPGIRRATGGGPGGRAVRRHASAGACPCVRASRRGEIRRGCARP